MLDQLEAIIRDRRSNPVAGSYTSLLFAEGREKIAQKVGEEAWNEIALEITSHIRENGIGDGLEHGVQRIGGFLAEHFPIQPDDVNELPDEVTFG